MWLICAVLGGGCGTVRVADPIDYDADGIAQDADGAAADAATDSDADIGGADALDGAGGATCTTDEGCVGAGDGICRVGRCEAGGCVVASLPTTATCTAAGGDPRCSAGACDGQGACVSAAVTDGSPCDADGTPCSVGDTCEAGVCRAGAPYDCSAGASPCQIGVCSAGSGGTPTCALTAVPAGEPCDDGAFCTIGTSCDATGGCGGGEARSCAEAAGPCLEAACDEVKDACQGKPKAAGLPCDDGAFCSETEACDASGACATLKVRTCPDGAAGSCKVGGCDEAQDACALSLAAVATACDDGDACSVGEACGGDGTCGGGKAKACSGDACNVAACDAATGLCKLLPLQGQAPCDDGKPCTTGDACDGAGACKAKGWDATCTCGADADCDDGNPCSKGSCQTSGCTFATTGGEPCDDGDPCTTDSICDAAGACTAKATYDCSQAEGACLLAVCEAKAGKPVCTAVPKGAGAACSDGDACTIDDGCDGQGGCAGSAKPCATAKACTIAGCNASSGLCTATPAAAGAACDDGDACTAGDACGADGSCQAGGPLPDYAPCDDGAATTSADLCLAKVCKGFALLPVAGPVADVAYAPLAKTLLVAAPAAALPQLAAAGAWQLWHLQPAAGGGKLASLATGGASGPALRGVGAMVAGGGKGTIWLAYQSGGAWKWTPSAGNNLALQLQKALGAGSGEVDWVDVSSTTIGNVGHHVFAGWSGAAGPGGGVVAHCNGAAAGTGSFTCTANKYAATIRPLAASASWSKPSATAAAVPGYDVLALSAKAPGAAFDALLRYRWDPKVPTFVGETLTAIPPQTIAATAIADGGLWRPTTTGPPAKGSSELWAAGPAGSVVALVAGAAAAQKAEVLASDQPAFLPRAVFALPGAVAIVGDRPSASGGRAALLLIHREEPGTQGAAAAWQAFELALPADCPALQARGGASDGKAIAVGGVGCAGGSSGLTGWLYVR